MEGAVVAYFVVMNATVVTETAVYILWLFVFDSHFFSRKIKKEKIYTVGYL